MVLVVTNWKKMVNCGKRSLVYFVKKSLKLLR